MKCALCVANSTESFSFEPWTHFWPLTLLTAKSVTHAVPVWSPVDKIVLVVRARGGWGGLWKEYGHFHGRICQICHVLPLFGPFGSLFLPFLYIFCIKALNWLKIKCPPYDMSYNLHFLWKRMEDSWQFVDSEKTQHRRIRDLVPFYPPACVMHTLSVASSAHFSIVPWTLVMHALHESGWLFMKV